MKREVVLVKALSSWRRANFSWRPQRHRGASRQSGRRAARDSATWGDGHVAVLGEHWLALVGWHA